MIPKHHNFETGNKLELVTTEFKNCTIEFRIATTSDAGSDYHDENNATLKVHLWSQYDEGNIRVQLPGSERKIPLWWVVTEEKVNESIRHDVEMIKQLLPFLKEQMIRILKDQLQWIEDPETWGEV